jgi:hypothetical protein
MPYFPPSGGSGSGVTTVGTFSSTSEVNGAAISSSTITFGPADGTNPGMVTTGAQTFAGAKTFTSQISASAGIYVAPSYNIALDSAASIVFSVNNTSTIGTPTSYAQYMYGSRYYLNSTAYIDGGTAGTVLITGGTGVNTALAVQASNAAGQTNFILSNTAASATTNSAVFELTNLTSTGQRTTFQFNASFSNVTDASRTSLITMQGASAGTFGNVMQFAGLIPTLYGQLTVPGISLTAPLVANATSISTDTTTGLIIGTATTQKLGFFNATPVVQQSATNDLGTTLSNLGFRASGTAYPITTSGGVILSGGLTSSAGSALTGNVRYNSQINTTSQTITTSQPMFQIGNSTSAITLTLPATTTVGYAYTLTNINTGLVTVVATINGATNYVLSQWQSITVFSTSTSGSWYSANNLATYSAQTNISANYTVLPNDSNIFATGTITVTLPSAVVFGGREITIYNVGTGTITVAATAGTVSIASIAAAGGAPANNSVAYVSNGTNWYTA